MHKRSFSSTRDALRPATAVQEGGLFWSADEHFLGFNRFFLWYIFLT